MTTADSKKYTIVFPEHHGIVRGIRGIFEITREALHCNAVRNLSEVPVDSRPILFGANVPYIRAEWGKVRDDAIIYELEQHSWWLPDDYVEWLTGFTVWSCFKGTVPNSIYVPAGYSPLFDVPYKTYESNEKWIDVLHYGGATPHRSDVLRSISKAGLNVVNTNSTFDEHLYRLIDASKCTVSINIGGSGDGRRFTVVRNFIPMCRGVAVVAERTPDIGDCGWIPVTSEEDDFPRVVSSVVSSYKEFGRYQRELIMRHPFSEIVRRALELS